MNAAQRALKDVARRYGENDLAGALKAALAGLNIDPEQPELLQAASGLALRLQLWPLAETLLDRCLEQEPMDAEGLINRGVARERQGSSRLQGALEDFQQASGIRPDDPLPPNNAARIWLALGDHDQARTWAATSLKRRATYAPALVTLGDLARAVGDNRRALGFWTRAVDLDPGLVGTWKNIALVHAMSGDLEQAIATYQSAMAAAPGDLATRLRLADLLNTVGQNDKARDLLDGIADPKARLKRPFMLPTIGPDEARYRASRDVFEAEIDALLNDPPSDLGNPLADAQLSPFRLAYHGLDDRHLNERLGELMRRCFPFLRYRAAHCASKREGIGQQKGMGDRKAAPSGRLKVGFVSSFFKGHSIGRLNRRFIERFDRERFEVFVIRPKQADDDVGRAIDAAADRALVLYADDLSKQHEHLAALELDALVYTDLGMSAHTWHLAQARLAPLQCVTIGHPVTSGLPEMDYFLSSELYEPEGSDDHYTEKLVRFRHPNFSYPFPDLAVRDPDRTQFGFRGEDRIYLCSQTLFKLNPSVDHLFAGICEADPLARLVFVADPYHGCWQALLEERFRTSLGAGSDRVTFVPRQSGRDYFTLLATADVILDIPTFSGGNTSLEAFACGTPVVTQWGPFLRGNVTAGLYRQMGLDAAVAENAEGYLERALTWADRATPEARDIRQRILGAQDLLFDREEPIRELEEFLETKSRI
ncbi:MAG: tetratricopeptide repeat protein [Magnetovibrionaceae bacterium]